MPGISNTFASCNAVKIIRDEQRNNLQNFSHIYKGMVLVWQWINNRK